MTLVAGSNPDDNLLFCRVEWLTDISIVTLYESTFSVFPFNIWMATWAPFWLEFTLKLGPDRIEGGTTRLGYWKNTCLVGEWGHIFLTENNNMATLCLFKHSCGIHVFIFTTCTLTADADWSQYETKLHKDNNMQRLKTLPVTLLKFIPYVTFIW